MSKEAGPQPGGKTPRPASGKNGPNGSGGGTRTFKPAMPKTNAPREGGTKK